MFIPSQTYSFSYDSCRVVDEPMRVVCFRDRCFVSPFVQRVDRCRQSGITDCRYGQHRVGRGGGGGGGGRTRDGPARSDRRSLKAHSRVTATRTVSRRDGDVTSR